jgi:hypothetical protein
VAKGAETREKNRNYCHDFPAKLPENSRDEEHEE